MAIKIAGVDVINDDRELVLAKLTDINETINDTAVDVFVYDTSKDSDGGAWRHRTQHTSWYNEGASSTRGSRKEFPAVAVIVAEGNKVTIYDGDDPSLPMWMVFNAVAVSSSTADWWRFQRYATCIFALNGVVIWGTGTTGCSFVSFAGDFSGRYDTGSQGGLSGSVATAEGSTVNSGSLPDLVDDAVNDVAMTVLPNAPTDPATGLPVPTIAVATNGGVSVIKDDGTVVDITHSVAADIFTTVSFTNDNRLATFLQGVKDVYVMPIPASDYSVDLSSDDTTYNELSAPYLFSTSAFIFPSDLKPLATPDGLAIIRNEVGAIHGISQLAEDTTTPANGMVAYTTSDYTTGWMNGDIKLAALADTTAETLSGSELVVDGSGNWVGDFDSSADVSEWTDISSGTGNFSWNSSGYIDLNSVDSSNRAIARKTFTTVIGQTYNVSVENVTGPGMLFRTGQATNSTAEISVSIGQGTHEFTFVAEAETSYVTLYGPTTNGTISVDNISVRLADPDRSVKGKGLGVHGSITKAAVATGADVVAYSGFSASNYLEQPYNSDLDFGAYTGTAGTGDFCVMGWVKGASVMSTATIISRCSSASNGFHLFKNTTTTTPYARFRIGSTYLDGTTGIADQWNHLVAMRKDGVAYIYKNGVLENSASISTDVSGSFATEIGWSTAETTITGLAGISLLRISATTPTADQIRKIYEDEKFLFQDSAKATLTGSSDAVTALAHDPDTGLLHVGTSGGRSVFQGLRRVDETETAVTTAISAVDGLVVEQ